MLHHTIAHVLHERGTATTSDFSRSSVGNYKIIMRSVSVSNAINWLHERSLSSRSDAVVTGWLLVEPYRCHGVHRSIRRLILTPHYVHLALRHYTRNQRDCSLNFSDISALSII